MISCYQGVIRDEFSLFVPVIERIKDGDEFLADDPKDLIASGEYSKVPWLMGVNSGEGLLYTIRKKKRIKVHFIGRYNVKHF